MSSTTVGKEQWPVQVFRYTLADGWATISNADHVQSEAALMATPQLGSISVPRLKARIRLYPKNCSDRNGTAGGSFGSVTRRLDTVCVPLYTGGAIVLKFRSKEECVEFSDRLVSLNPGQVNVIEGNISGGSRVVDDEHLAAQRRMDTMSYIVRLLHDADFMEFVDKLQDTLMESEDGPSVLAALQHRMSGTTEASVEPEVSSNFD